MKLRKSQLCFFLILIFGISIGKAPKADAEENKKFISTGDFYRIGDIVFPEAQDWRRIDEFPGVSAKELDTALVARMFNALPQHSPENDPTCSFRNQIIQSPDLSDKLHRGDILGAGDDDLIYTGPTGCREGEITIIWRHVHDPANMLSVTLPSKILRVEPKEQYRFTDVSIGCCGTPYSIYHIETLSGGSERSVYIYGVLQIPFDTTAAHGRVRLKHATPLKWTPNDAPDRGTQDFLDGEGYDSKGRTFPAGAEGQILLVYKDAAGKIWRLVAVTQLSASSVGWVSD